MHKFAAAEESAQLTAEAAPICLCGRCHVCRLYLGSIKVRTVAHSHFCLLYDLEPGKCESKLCRRSESILTMSIFSEMDWFGRRSASSGVSRVILGSASGELYKCTSVLVRDAQEWKYFLSDFRWICKAIEVGSYQGLGGTLMQSGCYVHSINSDQVE